MKETENTTEIDVEQQYRITPAQQALASCTGAVITSIFVTPLDVVKTRLQVQQKLMTNNCFLYCNGLMDHLCSCQPTDGKNNIWFRRPGHFSGTIDAFIKISRHEGMSSLWSGLSPTLVLAVPATIIYFVAYEQLRFKFKEMHNRNRLPGQPFKQPFWVPLIAGATARVFSVSIVSPLELIRTKMQSQRLNYKQMGDALKSLVKSDGIKGLWKGVFPTLLRDVPFSAIYWLHYETIKAALNKTDAPSFSASFIAGAISGGIAATVTVPFDVVKTHQQIEFGEKSLYADKPKTTKTSAHVIKEIYYQHGPKGLFAGIVPRLIKVAPACAIMISSFEYGKVFFNRLANQNLSLTGKELQPSTTSA